MPSDSDKPDTSIVNHRSFADQVDKQYEHTGFGTAATLINGVHLPDAWKHLDRHPASGQLAICLKAIRHNINNQAQPR